MNKQTNKVNFIKKAFSDKYGDEVTFQTFENKYFLDLRIKYGDVITGWSYQVFIGPRGGIKFAKKTTFGGYHDYIKIFRSSILPELA